MNNEINFIKLQKKRKKIIDNSLEQKYSEKYRGMAKLDNIYNKYIDGQELNLDKCLNMIDNKIKPKIERDERKYNLDEALKKNKMSCGKYGCDTYYSRYIDYNEGSINDIIKLIQNKIEMNNRQLELDNIIKNKCEYSFRDILFYENYIKGIITLDEATLQLDCQIMKKNIEIIMNGPRRIFCEIIGNEYYLYTTMYPKYQKYIMPGMSMKQIREIITIKRDKIKNYYENIRNDFDKKRLIDMEILYKLPDKEINFRQIKFNLGLKTINQILYHFCTSSYPLIYIQPISGYENRYIQSVTNKLKLAYRINTIEKPNNWSIIHVKNIIDQLK